MTSSHADLDSAWYVHSEMDAAEKTLEGHRAAKLAGAQGGECPAGGPSLFPKSLKIILLLALAYLTLPTCFLPDDLSSVVMLCAQGLAISQRHSGRLCKPRVR